ncbi:thioesterase II family protein [Paenibacillus radicis (ex Gao et al. 2016)]|uniref:Thioesterase n=1 Tax=Paenibacillus radicis (ex Gao et al. 2016) TaxID=1737354 RepID=A0A917HU42_9BACL|nr:thioesterase [Paenibacillus radicis (ex Gao et al. 2016)]GGG89357.1 thioesterase [Paenibacillus radicis (ex Gao et al. 2016)]
MSSIKLFTLPYAGGSTVLYFKWKKRLDERIELCPLELAGRGARMMEPPYANFEAAVEESLHRILLAAPQGPFALFGHSMGGTIAFEIVQSLQSHPELANQPVHLFLSGTNHPAKPSKNRYSHLDDREFVREVAKISGVPSESWENPDFVKLFLPTIRSDFKMYEERSITKERSLIQCPVSIVYGSQDPHIDVDHERWLQSCSGACRFYEVAGDHFFIQSNEEQLIQLINHTLCDDMQRDDDRCLSTPNHQRI